MAGQISSTPVLSPNVLGRHAELVEHREQQVGHVRVLREPQVTAALQLSRCAAGQHDRQRAEVVLVAVAQRAAVEHQRVIEQRAVAVGRGSSAARGSTRTSSCGRCSAARTDPCCRGRSSGATGCGTDRGWSSPGTRRVLSSRANISVETRVMSDWNAITCRSISSLRCSWNVAGTPVGTSGSVRSSRTLRFGPLNPPLDLAHVVEILRQASAIAGRQILLQRRRPGPSPSRAGCATPGGARAAPRR